MKGFGNTIEKLENDFWGEPEYDSNLVLTIHKVRKKQLEELSPEEIRVTIGQNLSLPILIPIALNILKSDILVDASLYEGDLLQSVLKVKSDFWADNVELTKEFHSILLDKKDEVYNAGDNKIIMHYEAFINRK